MNHKNIERKSYEKQQRYLNIGIKARFLLTLSRDDERWEFSVTNLEGRCSNQSLPFNH